VSKSKRERKREEIRNNDKRPSKLGGQFEEVLMSDDEGGVES